MTLLFRNLEVYRQSITFADRVIQMAGGFPSLYRPLADQWIRAAISISQNLAEGNGRFHDADRRRFIYIARGSACECVPLIELAARRGLVEKNVAAELLEMCDAISAKLTALANRRRNGPQK